MIGRTIGQYQVIDKIGEGGMGAVYKAEDTTLHRLVALKTLSGHLTEDEEAQERFVREAQSASSLNHPNITTVHEFIEDGDTRLICMEYVEGKTIRDMVESGIISVRKAIDIITQAAEALEAAHNKGILHRDVKSANIMVNMEGRVKVMDFGLAQLAGKSQLTRTGTTMGTLSYSSPEQISGRTVDKRSEIFSLGIVFYELLTGKLPFAATNEAEILFAIINNEPPKPSTVREDVPELVEAVLTRMLEKDPELRYPNCGDVINDLKGIRKEMETSTVSITGALHQMDQSMKSKRGLWIGLGTTAVVLIAAGLLFLPGGPKLDRELAVVCVFENISGDPLLDRFGSQPVLYITQGLEVSGLLATVDASQALQLHSQIRSGSSSSDGSRSIQQLLARGTGAGWVITGHYWQQGDDLLFQAEIIDATRGKEGQRVAGTETLRGTVEAPDSLMITLRDQTIALLAPYVNPMAEFVTLGRPSTSLEAFRYHVAAQEAFVRHDYQEALQLNYQALEEDSDYIAPLLGAITTTHNRGLSDPVWYPVCDSLVQIADSKRDQMSPWERSWLDDIKGWLYGDRELSYRAYQGAEKILPIMNYELGLNAGIVNRPDEAVQYLRKMDLESPWFQPWTGTWTVFANNLNRIGRHRKALKVIRHGQSVHPDNRTLLMHEGRTLAAMGRLRDLDRVIERSLTILPTGSWAPADLMTSVAEILLTYDQEEAANQVLERALEWYNDHPDVRETLRAYYARTLLTAKRYKEAQVLYEILVADRPEHLGRLMYYGISLAALNEQKTARQVCERLTQVEGQQYLKGEHTYARACIVAHLGELDEAMQLLEQAYREGNGFGWGLVYSIEMAPFQDYPPFQEWLKTPRG